MEKRSDGFHNIETIYYPISLCDILEIIPSEKGGIDFTTTGLPVPGEKGSNLVLKAAVLLTYPGYSSPDPSRQREGSKPPCERSEANWVLGPLQGLRIHLHKVIPTGSGLGGGSSDGAFTLKLLNDLLGLSLSDKRMEALASELGSDCAFFIRNRPVFAFGRGDQFEPVEADLSGCRIVVVIPPVHVSTSEAYAMITPRKPAHALKEIIRLPVEQWKGRLTNDFEEPVMNRYQVIREIKDELYSQGAVYAAMSGSGAAVFGIFPPDQTAGILNLSALSSYKSFTHLNWKVFA